MAIVMTNAEITTYAASFSQADRIKLYNILCEDLAEGNTQYWLDRGWHEVELSVLKDALATAIEANKRTLA